MRSFCKRRETFGDKRCITRWYAIRSTRVVVYGSNWGRHKRTNKENVEKKKKALVKVEKFFFLNFFRNFFRNFFFEIFSNFFWKFFSEKFFSPNFEYEKNFFPLTLKIFFPFENFFPLKIFSPLKFFFPSKIFSKIFYPNFENFFSLWNIFFSLKLFSKNFFS